MEFFGLHKLFGKIRETRSMQEIHKYKEMDLMISILMSAISSLICITLPFAMIASPMELFNNPYLSFLGYIAQYIERNLLFIDQLILVLSLFLLYAGLKIVLNAFEEAKISPWVLKGKYLSRKKTMVTRDKTQTIGSNVSERINKPDRIDIK